MRVKVIEHSKSVYQCWVMMPVTTYLDSAGSSGGNITLFKVQGLGVSLTTLDVLLF